jgi:hypothetical protein
MRTYIAIILNILLRFIVFFYDDGCGITVRCCCLPVGSAASVLRPGAGLDCQPAGRGHLQAGGPAAQGGLHHLVTVPSIDGQFSQFVQYTGTCRRQELTLVHNAEEENRTAEEGRTTESPPEGDQCQKGTQVIIGSVIILFMKFFCSTLPSTAKKCLKQDK